MKALRSFKIARTMLLITKVSSNSAYSDWANVWNRKRLYSFPTDGFAWRFARFIKQWVKEAWGPRRRARALGEKLESRKGC